MKTKRKPRIPYEINHKTVNYIEYKLCSKCEEWLPMNDQNFYKNKSSPDGFNPYCKECTKVKALKWAKENPDKMKAAFKKCDSQAYRKELKREYSKRQKESGYYKRYQEENKDKFYQYGINRKQHKDHDITDQEWFECLDYFNNSCAYCGISEGDAVKQYGQLLHKEHVEQHGANDITNCVPACKSCNSLKWEYELNEWYNENNPLYSKRRYNKIIKWLLSFATIN